MDNSELSKLDELCTFLYTNGQGSILERLEAQRWLLRLQSSAQYLPQLKFALKQSTSQYTLLYAAKSVLLVLSNDWRNVSPQERAQLQVFLLQRVTAEPNPSNFVSKTLVQALCRLTKLGWVSDPHLRTLMDEMVRLLQMDVAHAVLALNILSDLIGEFEMGRTEPSGRLDPEGRQAAQSFRDQDGLSRAFALALSTVHRAFAAESNVAQNRTVLRAALGTLQTCLAYDFVGTGYTESDDVVACLYIPVEWTRDIANADALRLLFRIYRAQWAVQNEAEIDASEEGAASMALQCVALLAATRRSVFDEDSRQAFLVALLEGSTQLMTDKPGLSHSEACLHHLCRLLSRMKSHFQLVELAKPPQYDAWLRALAAFTEDVLGAWRSVSSRSVHYIVRLWGALVLPTPYLRMREAPLSQRNGLGDSAAAPTCMRGLADYVPRVVQAFVATRADMCSAAALEELEDGAGEADAGNAAAQGFGGFGSGGGIEDNPLDDEGMLLEQLTPLSTLARFRYGVSAEAVASLFLRAMGERARAVDVLSGRPQGAALDSAKRALADAQARLAFLTYVVGAIVGGHVTRVSARAIDRLEELNAELAALVFKMVADAQRTEEVISSHGESPAALIFGFGNAGWRLELASLYFFRCFQALYIESRAREDEAERPARNRSVELVEDPLGFMSFSYMRGPAAAASGEGGAMHPFFHLRPLLAAAPSMDSLGRGLLADRASRDGASTEDSLVVDEVSAGDRARQNREMNDEASARASAMQRSISARVGVPGGDRALLDMAMRRVFLLLQYAQHVNERSAQLEDASAPVVLVQRALSVLYQLSMGVTIVHAGHVNTPRLMSSGRLLLESAVIQDLLRNPSADRFPLLREPKHGRARSFLMATLAKLLYTQTRYPSSQNGTQVPETMFDVNANVLTAQDQVEERFVAFMQPMTHMADGVARLAATNPSALRDASLRAPLIGLLRDLRGVISSATAAREYELIFSWFYPTRIQLLALAAEVFNDDFEVMVPLLKLLSELVHNRGSRIAFPQLSAGGLILFREAARVLVAYCSPQLRALSAAREAQRSRHEQRESLRKELVSDASNVSQTLAQTLGSDGDPLSMQALQEAVAALGEEILRGKNGGREGEGAQKLGGAVVRLGPDAVGPGITVDLKAPQQKCVRVCVVSLARMLNGRYAPLGTFELFGDSCLLDARRVTLELALCSAPRHTMSFPKMAKALVSLLNHLSERFIISLVDIASPLFARAMGCLGEALVSSVPALSSLAAATIESIALFRCRAAAAAHRPPGVAEDSEQSSDPLLRIRAVLNPEHRSRGDTTSLEEYRKAARLFKAHEEASPELFGSLLAVIMDALLTNGPMESSNQWSIAKPVMPLILCAPQEFERQRASFLSAQSAAREPRVREAFDALFGKLAPALSDPALFGVMLRSNDVFSKQLCAFCSDLRKD